ncbi:hypothetical protein MLD38_028525 [Melastoma candidum]|uniref:Uncharacterized protein n=1 Tax=Melastoma candidum TaxID=119954 RepID=A0ACB9N189_9MYRT|nr:hypothetical protein MLD38_028525 [Melastoma candidum]
MEAATPSALSKPGPPFRPDTNVIVRKLLRGGVQPTPKIIHTLRKKAIQKHNRRMKKDSDLSGQARDGVSEEYSEYLALREEYREFDRAWKSKRLDFEGDPGSGMVGLPWEGIDRVRMREALGGLGGEEGSGVLGKVGRREGLRELGEMFEDRRREELRWLLDDDDLESDEERKEGLGSVDNYGLDCSDGVTRSKRIRTEDESIKYLVARLGAKEIDRRDWKLRRMMKLSGLQFSEKQLLKILQGLGRKGHWKQALSAVEWVYDDKVRVKFKSRFVYTKLLAVLGDARRPLEALRIFNLMREDYFLYPDMAAYHSIAVTLGQGGLVRELIKLIECLKQKPTGKINHLRRKNWDPVLSPDLVVFNAVLNACVPSQQWKGVFWVFEQLRKNGIRPNGASYGLAMEVMLKSGKYDMVHEFFIKMRRSGEVARAITYKILVKCFSEEGRIDEAVETVREMEQRGIVGTAGVYYELACCLCSNGRWEQAMSEVRRLRKLHRTKPLAVTFTGMIVSAMEGGYLDDCLSIFNSMKGLCAPNIGTINTMLRVYLHNDMFSKAKELFEETKAVSRFASTTHADSSLMPDEYTYAAMLEVSAAALQWEYFEYVYKEMMLSGYRLNHKQASLLLAACRGGKGHLLEHAFDNLIDAGEVPCPEIFFEMVIQAMIHHNIEKAVSLIRVMSLASFQVGEKQWSDLFTKNRDWISTECLANLLEALSTCEITEEATIKNLLRSQCLLRESTSPMGTKNLEGRDEESESVQICPSKSSATCQTGCLDLDSEDNGSCANFDEIITSFNTDGSLKEIQEVKPGLLPGEFGNPRQKLPSAEEVLENWRQSQLKEGISFRFQVST